MFAYLVSRVFNSPQDIWGGGGVGGTDDKAAIHRDWRDNIHIGSNISHHNAVWHSATLSFQGQLVPISPPQGHGTCEAVSQ